MFTADRLLALCPGADPVIVDECAPALEARYALLLTTPLRLAHFIAQVAHESAGFTRLEEDLHYSRARIPQVFPRLAARALELASNPQALANAAYAWINGNGDEASGDGYRYRGRGLIQITGKRNYAQACLWSGVPAWLLEYPDEAALPENAVAVALGFWRARDCNAAADRDDIETVTRLINGPALAGLDHRRALLAKAKEIFTDAAPLIA